MIRELPHWTIFELCQVELECGVQGLGEIMRNNSAHAVRLLCELERYPHVKIYESPIPQSDVGGNQSRALACRRSRLLRPRPPVLG